MPTIPDELKTFKNSVSGGIDSMNSIAIDLSTKLTELFNSNTTAKSGFSSYYNSQNKENVLTTFNMLEEIIASTNDSVDSNLIKMVTKSNELIQKIDRMEELKAEIEVQDGIIRDEDAKANDDDDSTVPNYNARSTALGVKTNDEREFATLLDDSTEILSELKNMDSKLDFSDKLSSENLIPSSGSFQNGTYERKPQSTNDEDTLSVSDGEAGEEKPTITTSEEEKTYVAVSEEETQVVPTTEVETEPIHEEVVVENKEETTIPVQEETDDEDNEEIVDKDSDDYTAYLEALKYGTFEKRTYTASNGVKLRYYVYIPDYGQEVDGLPVHLYLHGSGEAGNRVLTCGLPELINNREITPSGIVVCIQADAGRDFYRDDYQDAMLELCDTIAEENNGDKNRLSVSGHSMGADTGYKMIARYPDRFTAFVPISGRCDSASQIKESDTPIWIFHGSTDKTRDYNNAVQTYNYLSSEGSNIEMHTFNGAGHSGVQTTTFEHEFEYNGEMINPLEWAFKQK